MSDLFKGEGLDDLFNAIERGDFDGASENTAPIDAGTLAFEAQFMERYAHDGADLSMTDRTQYWDTKLEPQLSEIITACDALGIPLQAAALVNQSENGLTIRHFKGKVETPETLAAYRLYHLPHGVSHLVMMLSQMPMMAFGGDFERSTPHFNHLTQFEEEIVPLVATLQGQCEILQLPLQICFLPVLTEDNKQFRGIVSCKLVPCEFKAAYLLYETPAPIVREVLSIYADINDTGEDF